MNDETKDPVAPVPADAAAPPPNAEVAAAAPEAAVAPVDAKPPEAMPVIFNTDGVTPPAPQTPSAGGPMAALRSGVVLLAMMVGGYFLLTWLGLMKPVGMASGPETSELMAKAQRDGDEADRRAAAEVVRRQQVTAPSYPAPTITVSAGMIGDRRNFPDPPPVPSASGSAKPGAKKGGLDEAQTIDAARTSLAKGEAAKALVILDGHDRDFAQGLMNPDAKVLRIEALARTGEDARAKELAEGFLADFPHSPLAPRVRALLDAINRKMAGQ